MQRNQAGLLRRIGDVAVARSRNSPLSSKSLRIFVVENNEDTAKYLRLYL